MTVYRIKSHVLRAEGHRFESVDKAAASRKLAEVIKRDPNAKLLTIQGVK